MLPFGPQRECARGVVDEVRRVADRAGVVGAGGGEARDDHRLRAAEAGDEDVARGVLGHRRRRRSCRSSGTGVPPNCARRETAAAERRVDRAVRRCSARASCSRRATPPATILPSACTIIGMRFSAFAKIVLLGGAADVVAGAVEGRVELAVGERDRRGGERRDGARQGEATARKRRRMVGWDKRAPGAAVDRGPAHRSSQAPASLHLPGLSSTAGPRARTNSTFV